ncbi:DUF202 domain-containing protein [Amycolatopsis sp. NPDC051102]|uniref:DUF202 domain-containing protein n=1 Tax=Amycolatopsis sp. NPDC051102 TaxID=3155163 RepID=UPI00342E266C
MTDPGLQPERTALAWQRTGLTAAVAGVLLLRTGVQTGSVVATVAGCSATGVLLLAWHAARRRDRLRTRRILAATALTTGLAGALTAAHVLWT